MLGARNLRALAGRPFNYADVGATAARLPAGYEHIRDSRTIGNGRTSFEAAADRLCRWELHRRSGLTVAATSARVTPDAEVLLGFGVGKVRLGIPCRVVYLVDEPDRRGFAYGTLTGHPESGEEQFLVTMNHDGLVSANVTAFSRPALWWSQLGSPVGRRVQRRVTARYLGALAE